MIYGQGVYVVQGGQHPTVQDAIMRSARRFYERRRVMAKRTRRLTARRVPVLMHGWCGWEPVYVSREWVSREWYT